MQAFTALQIVIAIIISSIFYTVNKNCSLPNPVAVIKIIHAIMLIITGKKERKKKVFLIVVY